MATGAFKVNWSGFVSKPTAQTFEGDGAATLAQPEGGNATGGIVRAVDQPHRDDVAVLCAVISAAAASMSITSRIAVF
jgi:hypothetical protein